MGMESVVAYYSDSVVRSARSGRVVYASSTKISLMSENGLLIHYNLRKFGRSNQEIPVTEKPIVSMNEKVFLGQALTDSSLVKRGTLSLGTNVFAAYMQWKGMNYEDGIVVSERLVYDNVLSSIHLERKVYQFLPCFTDERVELLTREIPNADESIIKRLDEWGIIKVGSWVNPGDILIGKVTQSIAA